MFQIFISHDLTTATFFFCFLMKYAILHLFWIWLNNGIIQLVFTFVSQTPITNTAVWKKVSTCRVPKIYSSSCHGWVNTYQWQNTVLTLSLSIWASRIFYAPLTYLSISGALHSSSFHNTLKHFCQKKCPIYFSVNQKHN